MRRAWQRRFAFGPADVSLIIAVGIVGKPAYCDRSKQHWFFDNLAKMFSFGSPKPVAHDAADVGPEEARSIYNVEGMQPTPIGIATYGGGYTVGDKLFSKVNHRFATHTDVVLEDYVYTSYLPIELNVAHSCKSDMFQCAGTHARRLALAAAWRTYSFGVNQSIGFGVYTARGAEPRSFVSIVHIALASDKQLEISEIGNIELRADGMKDMGFARWEDLFKTSESIRLETKASLVENSGGAYRRAETKAENDLPTSSAALDEASRTSLRKQKGMQGSAPPAGDLVGLQQAMGMTHSLLTMLETASETRSVTPPSRTEDLRSAPSSLHQGGSNQTILPDADSSLMATATRLSDITRIPRNNHLESFVATYTQDSVISRSVNLLVAQMVPEHWPAGVDDLQRLQEASAFMLNRSTIVDSSESAAPGHRNKTEWLSERHDSCACLPDEFASMGMLRYIYEFNAKVAPASLGKVKVVVYAEGLVDFNIVSLASMLLAIPGGAETVLEFVSEDVRAEDAASVDIPSRPLQLSEYAVQRAKALCMETVPHMFEASSGFIGVGATARGYFLSAMGPQDAKSAIIRDRSVAVQDGVHYAAELVRAVSLAVAAYAA
eukprot:CAMPEP_0117468166 /NCGR_PEP_ID=MMETSP0784-20121206/6034_1 /TAXON_ID=39447 /ORGANISM="" /LENGTH=606 /DNA_ID=CAMNT_0005262163 /DNA_START=62 /DNA_END=1879 /DNA_ORIENTATION=-